mmetsp:Transcript_66403/g.110398  ORF Transcript_66403/g.110398 Transcript_66403/m.110398 type:complete len:867 (+) Transcript_66403:140-2740(+)
MKLSFIVSFLAKWQVRALVTLVFAAITVGGVINIKSFMANLNTGVDPPRGSPSAIANDEYIRYFQTAPVIITILVQSQDGSPIVNTSATESFWPMVIEDFATPLTPAAANLSAVLRSRVNASMYGKCNASFMSFWDPIGGPFSSLVSSVVEWAEMASHFSKRFFDKEGSSTLMVVTIKECYGQPVWVKCVDKQDFCDPIRSLDDELSDYSRGVASGLHVMVTSFPDVNQAILGGIRQTLDYSTMTLPFALLVLALCVCNLRLLVCTLLNILLCLCGTIFVMYPISSTMSVSSETPPMIIAVGLAMSVDYSLFILTRFVEELRSGSSVPTALEVSLDSSGHTVLVSGATLTLCFCGMLLVPVSLISSMGLAAAITVFFAILLALVMTPTLLLTFPCFFSQSRWFGCSKEGICCTSRHASEAPLVSAMLFEHASDGPFAVSPSTRTPGSPMPLNEGRPPQAKPTGCWASIGKATQRFWPLVLLLAAGAAAPCMYAIPGLSYVEGVMPMMPQDTRPTDALVRLQDSFGVGTIFPSELLMVPPSQTSPLDADWLNASCQALISIAHDTSSRLTSEGVQYTMEPSALSGPMLLAGKCTGKAAPILANTDFFSNADRSAVKVSISVTIDPFSRDGQSWMRALRSAIAQHSHEGGIDLGKIHVNGVGPQMMDSAEETFRGFPLMLGVTLGVVFLVIGLAFRAVLVPIRAVICIVWMLTLVFGITIAVYQMGVLSGLQLHFFSPYGGALFWISPCIALPVMIGLGLDYDVFFIESVVEHYDQGATSNEAVLRALQHTGGIISAAGIIMVLAFGALLIGSTPALNQIGFMLVIAVLVDCFLTTKIIIPSIMAAVEAVCKSQANFWPRVRPLRIIS